MQGFLTGMGLPPFIAGALGDAVDASLNSLLDSYLNWDSTKCGEFDIEKALGDAITAGIQEAILGIGVGKLSGALMGKLKSSFGISGKPKKPSKPKKADSGHGSKSSSDGGACNIQLSRANCFAEGTLVDTEQGLLPIEQIEPGMRVWSYDTATEEWQLSEVTIAWRSWHDGEMVELEFAGESVLATAAHPIWLTSGERLDSRPEVTELPASESRLYHTGGRWVEAAHIRTGDAGLSRTAGTQPIHGRSIGSQARWVYNFEVAGTHTYTVGSTGLLVHNTCGEEAGTYSQLRKSGARDAHHVIQDAAVRDIPGYSTGAAPAIRLAGPSTSAGTPHGAATAVQRQAGGGTYAAERRIGYKAMRRGGVSKEQAREHIANADSHFATLGVGPTTPTRIPGNR